MEMTENQAARVLFLDMDGVMISDVGMKCLPANREDVRAHGYSASALFALEMLLARTGARICLATTWLWSDFKDGTPGLEMAICKLSLPDDRYFQDRANWIKARDGRRHPRRTVFAGPRGSPGRAARSLVGNPRGRPASSGTPFTGADARAILEMVGEEIILRTKTITERQQLHVLKSALLHLNRPSSELGVSPR